MKKYRAYIKLNNDIPTEMIISGKNKSSVENKLINFFKSLDKNIQIKVELKEVTFDGIDYIEKENNHGFK